MRIFQAIIKLLSLADHEGNLSISNIAVVAILIKIMLTPEISVVEVGALIGTLSNYSLKRFETRKAKEMEISESNPEAVDLLNEDLETLKDSFDKLEREAIEMRKIISEHNLSKAFRK